MPNGKGYEVIFGGVSSTTIPGFLCHRVNHRLVGANRSVIKEIPGSERVWHFDEHRGVRRVEIEASILADTFPVDRRQAVGLVAQWLDKPGYQTLEISDNPGKHYRVRLTNESDSTEWRNRASFTLEFEGDPYLYDNLITTVSGTVEDGEPFGPGVPEEDEEGEDPIGSIDAYPVITLKALTSVSGGVVLTCDGDILTITKTGLAAGSIITINSINYTIVEGVNTDTNLDGIFDDDATLAMKSTAGEFPVMRAGLVGGPTLVIDSDGGTGTYEVTLSWRKRYH